MSLYSNLTNHTLFKSRESEYLRWYPKTLTPVNRQQFILPIKHLQGIYLHVPFCDKLCSFCPFNKRLSNDSEIEGYVSLLIEEITSYAKLTESSEIKFIYFGGGTPSTLKPEWLERIILSIQKYFKLSSTIEVTLESHPTHLTKDKLKDFRGLGVNRISSGIQSFDDDLLERNGAYHTSVDALRAISNTGEIFGSIAIDILFRCVGQSINDLEKDIGIVLSNKVIDHISAYSLVLPNDANQPNRDMEARMTALIHQLLKENQFNHYASCASGGFDFAKKNSESKYELLHWQAPQHTFIGVGPGAFGFTGHQTTLNCLTLENYRNFIQNDGSALVSVTDISEIELMHRYFALGVKTLEVEFAPFLDLFGNHPKNLFRKQFDWLKENQLAIITDLRLQLTEVGSLFVDEINYCFNSNKQKEVIHPEEPYIRQFEREINA